MRTVFSIIFFIIAIALGACAVISRRSGKSIGRYVSALLWSLIPPVAGNLIIVMSGDQLLSTIGYYIYFLGMNLVMFSLLRFTVVYCSISRERRKYVWIANVLLLIDTFQYAVNPFLHQAFDTKVIQVDGYDYYSLVTHFGQSFHRVVDYGILAAVLVIFLVKIIRTPRIYAEKYLVIFLCMVLGTVWETWYIFSGSPIDRSMICFGVFGLLVFYFSIYYRPMRLLDRMLAGIASGMPEALFFFDISGHCIWANNQGIELAGIKNEDFDQAPKLLQEIFGDYGQDAENWFCQRVISMQGTDEPEKYYYMEYRSLKDANDRMTGSFLSIRDNTEEQLTLQKEKYIAAHDSLTGLYSREYLYTRISETLAEHPDTEYYIIYLDVNDFKMVNDVYGTTYGDQVLQDIADKIRGTVTQNCVYGRLGGDTFGVLAPAVEFQEARLEEVLGKNTVGNDRLQYRIQVHFGVYEVTDTDMDVSVMFDRAHMALATIKENYQTHIAFYDNTLRDQVLWNQQITTQLRDAIADRQVRPYLQPMVNIDGRVVGAEALVRWVHPDYGFLSPAAFIPVFERNGMIVEVDRYMWRCACEILARWQKEGREDMFISVNISPKDFHYMDVAGEIRSIVDEYQVPASKLRLEITETVMMTDIKNRLRILNGLKSDGFIVEMDDFGSGYSSLNLLKDIPVDVLKIDMAFLRQSDNEQKAETIVHNIISLTDSLGISALTEGVETKSQFDLLSEMGCKLFQGYYFSKPIPVEQFEELAKKYS